MNTHTREKIRDVVAVQRRLVEQFGGDHVATRAANAILRDTDISTLEELCALYEKEGAVVFYQDMRDMSMVGVKAADRIVEVVARTLAQR